MAVESVTVVAPEVRVGPFVLSKGICSIWTSDVNTLHAEIIQLLFVKLLRFTTWSSSGLVEQIINFQTLSLKDFSAFDLDPFLTIDDDYFYHTQNPRRPEVSIKMWTSPRYIKCRPLLCYVFRIGALTELLSFVWFYSQGWGCACEILLRWTEQWYVSTRPGSYCEYCRWPCQYSSPLVWSISEYFTICIFYMHFDCVLTHIILVCWYLKLDN